MTEYIYLIVLILEGMLLTLVGYLLLLTIAALAAPRSTSFPAGYKPKTRFAILVPAHNEERLLPELINSLKAQNYPKPLFDIFIVADNCSDRTADIGQSMEAHVYERHNTHQTGKGYALNWLYTKMKADHLADSFGAYVIFDADTVVDDQFLRVMDAHLQAGEIAIQGYYSVRNPDRSWGSALRYIALAVLHYLRPLGRTRLGGSAGLKGNGMCFSTEVYEQIRWTGSVTEDIEYHMELILDGKRVTFAPDACLAAEMPGSLSQAYTQNVRWESGRWENARRYSLPLFKRALSIPSYTAFDALMEHIIPPTTLLLFSLMSITGLSLVVGFFSGAWTAFWFGLLLFGMFFFYLTSGLIMVRAPRKVWLALFYAPGYMAWKIRLVLRIKAGNKIQGWVRTGR